MSKQPDWPRQLNEPFSHHRIADYAIRGLLSSEAAADRITEAFNAELKRRVTLMAYDLDMPGLPKSETQWLRLFYELCRRWQIPGFQDTPKKRRGAKTKWTAQLKGALFDDVTSLVKQKGITESSACRYIAVNARKFGQRYPTNPKTLHREFLRAKKDYAEIPF